MSSHGGSKSFEVGDGLNAATWTKSSFSATSNCVEVAKAGDSVMIRDSKDEDHRILVVSLDDWNLFVQGIKSGDFDDMGRG